MRTVKINRCFFKLINGVFLQGLLTGIILTLFLLYIIGWIGKKKSPHETGFFLPPPSSILHISTNKTYPTHSSIYKTKLNHKSRNHTKPTVNFTHQTKPPDALTNQTKPGHRILCLVSSCNDNLVSKAVHVAATWGGHCDTLLFMTSHRSHVADTLPIDVVGLDVNDGYNYLWEKTKRGLRHVRSWYNGEYDFVIKVDDDTFVIVENLRGFLQELDPEEALYAGHKQKVQGVEYMSGGAGYVLSKTAVNKLVIHGLDTNICDHPHKEEGGYISEDLQLGACFQLLGVKIISSMLEGKSRFLPFRLESHLVPELSLPWWKNHTLECSGEKCASHRPISFHYVKPVDMYNYYHLLYNVQINGM